MEKNILIVEDNALIAEDMADTVQDCLGLMPLVASSCSQALSKIDKNTVLGLLDIDVTDGPTYDVARHLRHLGIPFAFVSGNTPVNLPVDLKKSPYLAKPALSAEVIKLAKTLAANVHA